MVRHIICFPPSGYAVRCQALEKLLFFAYQGPVYSAEGLRTFSLRRAGLAIYLEAAIPYRCYASHVRLRLIRSFLRLPFIRVAMVRRSIGR
jgi:hypothetical protein